MLVLSRKKGEAIFIGKDIKITVLNDEHSGALKLGINAPRHIEVLREELKQSSKKSLSSLFNVSTNH